jgi:hypothetical protein
VLTCDDAGFRRALWPKSDSLVCQDFAPPDLAERIFVRGPSSYPDLPPDAEAMAAPDRT